MVDTLTLVLAAVVGYTVMGLAVKRRGLLPRWVRLSGPITTLHTERGRVLLDRLAAPKRLWRAWGNLGVGIALVVMAGSFVLVLFAGLQALANPQPSALTQPRNVLAIPGVNDFLPLSAAVEIVAALLVGLVVHEGGHGLMCRVEDIEVDSMGLALLAFVPIGAFVEPDEASRDAASRGAQTRMFAAGVTNNFAVAAVAFALLFGPVVGSIAVVSGVPVAGVLPGAAAAQAGIDRGDVITGVEGSPVADGEALDTALAGTNARTVAVQLRSGETVTVERSLVVTGAVADAPLPVNATIVAINGTTVHTEQAFRAALSDREVARITTADGETATTPAGAYTRVTPPERGQSPLANASGLGGERFTITRFDGQRIVDGEALGEALDDTEPGQRATVTGYHDGERRTYEVRLGDNPREPTGFLGVSIRRGTSGMTVDDFGIDEYPAATFLAALGGDTNDPRFGAVDGPLTRAYLTLSLPFAAVTFPGIDHPFPGFVGVYENFYVAGDGPLSFLGTGLLLLVGSLLFWTAWINVIIGQFNCVPAFPLDGGHILRTSTQAVVARLPVDDKHAATRAVTVSVGLLMLASLLLMVFGPQLLG
ncbi:site-2 protease family protein [Halosegnis sp.]|uniref:site-2 protease family protein n=1 Tax=Halosegnis sp. TaxID=2864959 RepID=UPI0035D43879